jgi:site-specific DNA-methyltransferase (adenine-specific)
MKRTLRASPTQLRTDRVLCGDCIALLKKLPENSARLGIADPPYFNVLVEQAWDTAWSSQDEYLKWTAQWLAAAMRVLVPGGLLYCFGQLGKREHVMLHLMSQSATEYIFHDLIIWDRAVGYNVRKDSFTPAYEMILVLRKGAAPPYFDKDAVREEYSAKQKQLYARDKRYKDSEARHAHLEKGKYATNLWRIPSLKGAAKEKAGHPSQKPEALIERIIKSSSAPGELVIDPFLGSGTTAVVAQRLGRNWIGVEKNKEYVQMARARLRKERSQISDNLSLREPF